MIYIDALSRAHAHRKINRTLKWFEEAVNNPVFLLVKYYENNRIRRGALLNSLDIIQEHPLHFQMPLNSCMGIIIRQWKKI